MRVAELGATVSLRSRRRLVKELGNTPTREEVLVLKQQVQDARRARESGSGAPDPRR